METMDLDDTLGSHEKGCHDKKIFFGYLDSD